MKVSISRGLFGNIFLECTHEHRLLENAQIGISGPVAWSDITLVKNTLQVEALLYRSIRDGGNEF